MHVMTKYSWIWRLASSLGCNVNAKAGTYIHYKYPRSFRSYALVTPILVYLHIIINHLKIKITLFPDLFTEVVGHIKSDLYNYQSSALGV